MSSITCVKNIQSKINHYILWSVWLLNQGTCFYVSRTLILRHFVYDQTLGLKLNWFRGFSVCELWIRISNRVCRFNSIEFLYQYATIFIGWRFLLKYQFLVIELSVIFSIHKHFKCLFWFSNSIESIILISIFILLLSSWQCSFCKFYELQLNHIFFFYNNTSLNY